MQKVLAAIMAMMLFGSAGCATMPTQLELAKVNFGPLPTNYEQSIENYMAGRLKDPNSATYRFEKPRKGFTQDGFLVGGQKHFGYIAAAYINARNSCGGYTGEQLYYFLFFDEGKIADVTDSFGPAQMAMYVDSVTNVTADASAKADSPSQPQLANQGATASPPDAKENGLIKKFVGSDMTTTRPFTAPDKWEIQWDAQGQFFSIYLKDGQGKLIGVVANQTGPGKGSAYQPKGGEYLLQVNAAGQWVIQVVNAAN